MLSEFTQTVQSETLNYERESFVIDYQQCLQGLRPHGFLIRFTWLSGRYTWILGLRA